jgi:hypothetical protein
MPLSLKVALLNQDLLKTLTELKQRSEQLNSIELLYFAKKAALQAAIAEVENAFKEMQDKLPGVRELDQLQSSSDENSPFWKASRILGHAATAKTKAANLLTAQDSVSVGQPLDQLMDMVERSPMATTPYPQPQVTLSRKQKQKFLSQIDSMLKGALKGKPNNPMHQGLMELKTLLQGSNTLSREEFWSALIKLIDTCDQAKATIAKAQHQALRHPQSTGGEAMPSLSRTGSQSLQDLPNVEGKEPNVESEEWFSSEIPMNASIIGREPLLSSAFTFSGEGFESSPSTESIAAAEPQAAPSPASDKPLEPAETPAAEPTSVDAPAAQTEASR